MPQRPAMTTSWTWSQVRARRLQRHRLTGRGQGIDCAAVVSAVCGAHAQVMSAAELSIALRLENVTRTQVRQALRDDLSLIKTFGPRGTVHLLAAADLPMWTGALSAVPSASRAPTEFGMTQQQTDGVLAAIGEALSGDAELTVDELGQHVVAATGSWAGELVVPAFNGRWPRWRLAIPAAGHRGQLCFGAERGRSVTYTSPSMRVPGFRRGEPGDSLQKLVFQYLAAFGPASPAQFAQWLAAPRRWAIELFEQLSDRLTLVESDGVAVYLPADDADPPVARPSGLRLLPYFDTYLVGSHPRGLVFPGTAGSRALSGGQAGTLPVLLINGEVRGIWRSRRSGRRIRFEVEPFGALSARQHAEVERQVARTAAILEGAPELTIGPINAGHHL